MNFGLFGRYFGFFDESDDPEERPWSPLARRVAYGVGGVVAVAMLALALIVLAGRRPPPPRLPEAMRTPAASGRTPAAAAGAASPAQPGDTAANAPDGSLRDETDERLRGMRRQVDFEAAVVAALRDQADDARRELAELQRQQAEARIALAELQRRPDVAVRPSPDRSVAEKLAPEGAVPDKLVPEKPVPERLVPAKVLPEKPVTERPAPERRVAERRPPEAPVPPTQAAEMEVAERAEPPRSAATPALDRALGRLRSPAAVPPDEATPQLRSPPPTSLGQIQIGSPETEAARMAAIAPVPVPAPAAASGPVSRRRVFLHYRTGSQPGEDEANDLAHRLLFSDFAYAETRTVPASTQTPMIRFYYREDAEAAARLAGLLGGSGLEFRVQDSSGIPTRAPRGTLEVWIP
jgi:hypothetical protein